VALVDAIVATPDVQTAPSGPEWPKPRQLWLEMQRVGNGLPDG